MTHNTSVLSMLSWPSRGMETTDNPSVVAAASNFSAMKQNQFATVYGGDAHLRKGGAGEWRNMITVRESGV